MDTVHLRARAPTTEDVVYNVPNECCDAGQPAFIVRGYDPFVHPSAVEGRQISSTGRYPPYDRRTTHRR